MWKEQARELYIKENKKINEIATILKKSRKTISAFLNSQKDIDEIKAHKKEVNKEGRKKYQRDWDRKNRNSINYDDALVEGYLMRRSHDIASSILSREKY